MEECRKEYGEWLIKVLERNKRVWRREEEIEGGGEEKPLFLKKISCEKELVEATGRNSWYNYVSWIKGEDMVRFMEGSSRFSKKEVPVVAGKDMCRLIERIKKLREEGEEGRRKKKGDGVENIHPFAVVVNSGQHWLLAIVDYAKRGIVLLDPYGNEVALKEVDDLWANLERNGWGTCVRKIGVQKKKDGNSCGYHVLTWCMEVVNQEVRNPRWVPSEYNIVEKVRNIYRMLEYKVGKEGEERERRDKKEEKKEKYEGTKCRERRIVELEKRKSLYKATLVEELRKKEWYKKVEWVTGCGYGKIYACTPRLVSSVCTNYGE